MNKPTACRTAKAHCCQQDQPATACSILQLCSGDCSAQHWVALHIFKKSDFSYIQLLCSPFPPLILIVQCPWNTSSPHYVSIKWMLLYLLTSMLLINYYELRFWRIKNWTKLHTPTSGSTLRSPEFCTNFYLFLKFFKIFFFNFSLRKISQWPHVV